MQTPLVIFTEKVMGMIKSMVLLAMRVDCRHGATAVDISRFLNLWTPAAAGRYHHGIVERALVDLQHDGQVLQAGSRWYLSGRSG